MNRIETAKSIHSTARDKGWWDNRRSTKTILMLVITELAEAVEADRKGRKADIKNYEAEIARGATSGRQVFEALIKDSVEDEIADAYIRLLDHLYYDHEEELRVPLSIDFDMNGTLADDLFDICRMVNNFEPEGATRAIELLCERYHIDLEFHVYQKMQYNEGREHMHGGKKY